MRRQTANRLLSDLGTTVGVKDLRLNRNDLAGLDLPNGTVAFEWTPRSGVLSLHSLVTKYLTKSGGPVKIFETLEGVIAATPELTAGARLWLRSPEEARDGSYGLFLTRSVEDDAMTSEVFAMEVEKLMRTTDVWQREVLPTVMKEILAGKP